MTSEALQDLIKTIRYKIKRGTTIKPDLDYLEEVLISDLDKLEKTEKVIKIIKEEGLIIKTDESNKDLPYLVMAMKLEDKIFIFYETFDEEKIKLLKEVLENAY